MNGFDAIGSALDDAGPAGTYTDLGNAERFALEHAHRLRYVAERRRWISWDGTRWRPDITGEADRAAKDTARRLLSESATIEGDNERKQAAQWAAGSQSEPRVRAMLALARTEPEIVVSERDLDAHPFLLSCGNGTIDLRTGQLRVSNPADLLTRGTAVDYNANASCPRWERFLHEIFAGDIELDAFMSRFIGYALTGDTREHLLVIAHGAGCNGKSVLLETLKLVLGDLAATAAFDTFTRARGDRGPRNDLARLRGARLVTASESGDGKRLDEATVKEITGGDTISARFLFAEHFEFRPEFKLLLVSNHRPRVDGGDDAIWRRLRLIPFEQSFEGREDRTLPGKLAEELPGILAWAVRGCLDWQQHGLGQAAAVTRATREYRGDEDTLGAFLVDCCRGEGETTATDLRAAYEGWCLEVDEKPLTSRVLGRQLGRRGITARRGAKGARIYSPISLGAATGVPLVPLGDVEIGTSLARACIGDLTETTALNGTRHLNGTRKTAEPDVTDADLDRLRANVA